ncbi:MAG: DUF5906 domain-containing protein [Methylococcales bacterium]
MDKNTPEKAISVIRTIFFRLTEAKIHIPFDLRRKIIAALFKLNVDHEALTDLLVELRKSTRKAGNRESESYIRNQILSLSKLDAPFPTFFNVLKELGEDLYTNEERKTLSSCYGGGDVKPRPKNTPLDNYKEVVKTLDELPIQTVENKTVFVGTWAAPGESTKKHYVNVSALTPNTAIDQQGYLASKGFSAENWVGSVFEFGGYIEVADPFGEAGDSITEYHAPTVVVKMQGLTSSCYDESTTTNIQVINKNETPSKLFIKDLAAKGHVGFFPSREACYQSPKILFCEGVATALALWKSTEIPCISVLMQSNYLLAAVSILEHGIAIEIILCGDTDTESLLDKTVATIRAGIAFRNEAKTVAVSIPKMEGSNKDFNDLMQEAGVDAVRKNIEEDLIAAVSLPAISNFTESENKEGVEESEQDDDGWKALLEMTVEILNVSYAIVMNGATAAIIKITWDEESSRYSHVFTTKKSFELLYANKPIQQGLKQVFGKYVPVYGTHATAWLQHIKRRQYLDGVTFIPPQYKDGVEIPAKISGDKLNLWQGYKVQAVEGDWELLRLHIKIIICNNDEACYEYFLNWLARGLQRPDLHARVAIAMKGLKGCGKSSLGTFYVSIFGQHGLQITNPKFLIGNFNAHMADLCAIFGDEVFFAGDRSHENILKGLITEPTLMIERKGIDAVSMTNRIKLIMASNNDWIVPASSDERRYFVLGVSDERIGDSAYFTALHDSLEREETKSAFLYDMLHRDISGFDITKIPETDALKAQRLQSLDSFGKYWWDVLNRGHIYQSEYGNDEYHTWFSKALTALIRQGYEQWCRQHRIGEHKISSVEKMGKSLTKWYGASKLLSAQIGSSYLLAESKKGDLIESSARQKVYHFGNLKNAIEAFSNAEKLSTEGLSVVELELTD